MDADTSRIEARTITAFLRISGLSPIGLTPWPVPLLAHVPLARPITVAQSGVSRDDILSGGRLISPRNMSY